MMQYMVEQQTLIAKEVMDEAQFKIYQQGIKEMERYEAIQDKQRVMQESQQELQSLLSQSQQEKIRDRIQAVMQTYIAENGHPMVSAPTKPSAAAADAEPKSSTESDNSDSMSSDDDFDDDSDEEDPVAKQARMVTLMLETQQKVAEVIMDADQLSVYSAGMRKIQEAPSMQAKQAAMQASKNAWHPLLSPEQQARMETQMKEAMAAAMTR